MQIKPIRTEADYEAALITAETLMDAKPNTPRADRLEVLATLIESYEEKHYPIGPPDPIEAIKHRMEALGYERKDIAPLIGGANRVSEVFSRRRGLSLSMIRSLHVAMRIPLETLVREYPLKSSKRSSKTAGRLTN
jgi:HTH-type transcriptional regulator/antitoxin HigA